ncbi:protein ANTI-SILENCING 1-like isoform X3 [Juglans microcarpa x Juglans regia]|uniref:protein ANTI-SILENCING 1-like isoform X3 n=1 Tax=Juglans microcarpa x Juglans regia TaxID=2249226 RepID=UPI001B7E7E91|nr:protein ANTI-SILENCING 1-like isoform X3 [Juglans microcarpa x Juglans regia]
MVEIDGIEEDLEFKWGKKKGVGKKGEGEKQKEVQFYQCFTYDGMEYDLYDTVYLHNDDGPGPYIGKLIEIWENPDKTKEVLVLWFFHPYEIDLEVEGTTKNELFLASGEGVGLANVNPLEAIAGKCDIICTSKDSRNPQPSDEELKTADFIFYRAFDVKHGRVLDKIEEEVAGIEVKFIFNRVDAQEPNVVLELDSNKKEVCGNAVASNKTEKSSLREQPAYSIGPAYRIGVESEISKTNDRQENISLDKSALRSVDFPIKGEGRVVKNLVRNEEKLKSSHDCNEMEDRPSENVICDRIEEKVKSVHDCRELDDRPSKKEKLDCSVKVFGDKKEKTVQKSPVDLNRHDARSVGTVIDFEDKSRLKLAKDSRRVENGPLKKLKLDEKTKLFDGKNFVKSEKVKSSRDRSELEDRPSKKAKFDGLVKVLGNRNERRVQKLAVDSDPTDAKALPVVTAYEDKYRPKLAKDSQVGQKGSSKKLKPDENTKFSNGKLPRASPRQFADEDKKIDHQIMEITPRPDDDKSKWFRAIPWEDRMKSANELGTLVLLQNLDPAYTSAEVEDIVWHGFKENCRAKMIQQTSISSPHCGQAFVIFKTREAAEIVVKTLDEGCLWISNGRPLVGSIGTPCFPEKKPTFFGHFAIDKLRYQMPREMREAVSTSHCSQPNTIEYDMAMEWCLLQEQSDFCWKLLYKQQGEELKMLKSN